MRILVAWDDPAQADLLKMYLGVNGNEAEIVCDGNRFLQQLSRGEPWDAVLLTTTTPSTDRAFEIFEAARKMAPETPIIGACPETDVYRIARFLTGGLRGYVIRDRAGDFMFLLQAVIEGAIKQAHAERERIVAERLRREIDSVRRLQETIIPRDIESPPGYDIVARYESSQIRVIGGQPVTLAGGDYYDAFAVSDDSLVLIVGDASGHGMKACMSIMTMHTLIRMIRSNRFRNTADFVTHVNNELCQQAIVNEDGGFITLLYGILNTRTHILEWTSAGHPVPLIQDLDSTEVAPAGDDEAPGLPLGILPDAEYVVRRTPVPPGSRLLMYTDGLAEAFSPEAEGHREFGEKGLRRTLKESAQADLRQTMRALFDASHAFTDGQGRHDDTSVLLLERDR
ncbi:Phosphoserine phosphatase RsbU [Maioricimonas rarisocia]|uniref:Phosphoserine phosphatase RsbU n=1 Tax=Maioricimonas rarisocia TaxID=2528026 RepID=A0A517Z8Q4_9PLAN|nr:SpoIIE family protein phosphatase [Maioricimonas rarisocia]QDU38829.1 Phosphoserine phosphatase RsbU [Maioricimonas rarisocia]